MSYTIGFNGTVWVSALLATFVTLLFLGLRLRGNLDTASPEFLRPSMTYAWRQSDMRWRVWFGTILRALPLAGLYFLLFSVVLYPVINVALQYRIYDGGVMRRELAEGILQLRIISLIAACSSAVHFVKGLGDSHASSGKYVGQYSFYFIVLAALWYVRIFGATHIGTTHIWGLPPDTATPTLLQACSWLLFFVIDDWIIISQYTTAFATKPIWHHGLRIVASNFVFMVLIFCILLSTSHWVIAVGTLVAQFSCLAYGRIDREARDLERSPVKFLRKLIGPRMPFH